MGIDGLTIKAEDYNWGYSTGTGLCSHQSYGKELASSDDHLLQPTFSTWPSAPGPETD